MINVGLPPIDPQRQGAVALPSIRTHLPEYFEDKGNDQSNPASVPAVGSPPSGDLLLPPMNQRVQGPYTLRTVFPELFQQTSRLEFHTGYSPPGASTSDSHRLVGRIVLPPPREQRISGRAVAGRYDELVASARRDDTVAYSTGDLPTPPTPMVIPTVPSCGIPQSPHDWSDSDCSLDLSPELLGAAKVLYEIRHGPANSLNYYESDADEDEDEEPVEEYPKNLKRWRAGGAKTRGTARISSAFEETSDGVETERDGSSAMVQGRQEEQASGIFYSSQPTKRLRLDVSQTSNEFQLAPGPCLRILPPFRVGVGRGVNDENTTSVISKKDGTLEAKVKPFAESTKGNRVVSALFHNEVLKQNHMNELPFACDSDNDVNTSELT